MTASLWMVVMNEYQSNPAVTAAEETMTAGRSSHALVTCPACKK